MSSPQEISVTGIHLVGLSELRKRWGWFVGLGVLLVILGSIAIGWSVLTTVATMVFLGWLMFLAGVMQTAHGFSCKTWGGFFIDLIVGLLYTVAAFMIITRPAETGIALTLLIAMLLIFGGIFRIVIAIATRFHNGVWLLLHGVVNLLLGISIWQNWPLSGLWVIGLFVGIDMVFNGWSLIMLGFAAKNLPSAASPA
jgi:uncharacterized membrane protein HdeD (DUF308 family)